MTMKVFPWTTIEAATTTSVPDLRHPGSRHCFSWYRLNSNSSHLIHAPRGPTESVGPLVPGIYNLFAVETEFLLAVHVLRPHGHQVARSDVSKENPLRNGVLNVPLDDAT